MIRPPSLQSTYDEFYSGDEAFVQPPPDATPEELEEHARKWEVARETGNFAELLVGNATPTKFVLRPLPGELYRKIVDMSLDGRLGMASMHLILVRAALLDVVNLEVPTEGGGKRTIKVQPYTHPDFGRIADAEVPNLLDRVDYRIVNELAAVIRKRAESLSPKS